MSNIFSFDTVSSGVWQFSDEWWQLPFSNFDVMILMLSWPCLDSCVVKSDGEDGQVLLNANSVLVSNSRILHSNDILYC